MLNIVSLYEHGQSVWLDHIDRDLVDDGGLRSLVEGGVRGVTSNPTIFQQAIMGGEAYDRSIRDLLQADHEITPEALHEWLTIQDVQMAADTLRPVYLSSDRGDGFVSIEVSPHLAYDADATIEAARHLWRAVDRPNVLVKIPATVEGLAAIEYLVGQGIGVNATLVFSVERLRAVMHAYARGLAANPNPADVTSVVSFFVSRLDSKADAALREHGGDRARSLLGRAGIAIGKLAYRAYRSELEQPSYRQQLKRGAKPQRLLWASTGVKDASRPPLYYLESLIGEGTVATVPPRTLDALQTNGAVWHLAEEGVDEAGHHLSEMQRLGVDLDGATQALETEGVAAFRDSFDRLLQVLAEKRFEAAKHYASSE